MSLIKFLYNLKYVNHSAFNFDENLVPCVQYLRGYNSLLFVTDPPSAPPPTIPTHFNMSHFALVNIVHNVLCFFFHYLFKLKYG